MTRSFRALVADDEVEDRIVMRRTLLQAGFDVDEAENGRRALDCIRHHDYDLIVLDIMMPQLDGFEVLRHLKSKAPETLLKTVVVSRLDLRDMKVFFPLCQVLEKPLDTNDLATIARNIRNARSGPEL